MEFREQAAQQADNGDLVFGESSVGGCEDESKQGSENLQLMVVTPKKEQLNEPLSNSSATEEENKLSEESDHLEKSNEDRKLDDELQQSDIKMSEEPAEMKFDEVSLDETFSGPGYKNMIRPSSDSQDSLVESVDETSDDDESISLSSSGSSFDSSSSSDYSTGSSQRENSEDSTQDLRLRPKKITVSLNLRETSSDTSVTDTSDVDGIVRKDRTNKTSTENTYNSCNDVTQISSEESLSDFTEGSSASEFRLSDREDNSLAPLSSCSTSTKSTTDIESGGIKDTRRRHRGGIAAGFVSLLGLGRFWLSPARAKCRYDTTAERRKLTEPDKSKATVAEIYPWIAEEEDRAKQEFKENKRQTKRKTSLLPNPEDIEVVEQC